MSFSAAHGLTSSTSVGHRNVPTNAQQPERQITNRRRLLTADSTAESMRQFPGGRAGVLGAFAL
jgi:hypothetical protein